METNTLSHRTIPHTAGIREDIGRDWDRTETPVGFREDFRLYPHQETAVRGILDLEDMRVINIERRTRSGFEDQAKLLTSAVVLSEPFGSGKTMMILAVILSRPVPRAIPEHVNALCIPRSGVPKRSRNQRDGAQLDPKYMSFGTEIIRKCTGPNALIRSNLIIVGGSVLAQWANTIREFTNLKCFVVGDVHSLKCLYKLYHQTKVIPYDIVLLKNGMVTGTFCMHNEDPHTKRDNRSLISAVSAMTAGSYWARVIYDDFDTINIPAGCGAVPALFTIYVSATTRTPPMKTKVRKYKNIREALTTATSPLDLITKDQILFTNFNVRNDTDFVNDSIRITYINMYKYVYDNPGDNFMRLMGAMGEAEANNIMEMLNGDALATAADAMGIKSNSVADIFEKMLDKKYKRFLLDQRILDTVANTRDKAATLEEHPDGRHTAAEIESIRTKITHSNDVELQYTSEALTHLLNSIEVEYRLAKEQDGAAIARVVSNIKEGACQVCRLPLDGFDVFITRCCGLILCDMCGIKGNMISNQFDYKTGKTTLRGSCANCKAVIYPQRDLIFVDQSFDMDSLLKAHCDGVGCSSTTEPEEEEVDAPPPKNPKLIALLDIIRGADIPEREVIKDAHIDRLIVGRVDAPPPVDAPKKVLVFAGFGETLSLIEGFLTEQAVPYMRLSGTHYEKAATVAKFEAHGNVLLINSQINCAGLNLQFASDLVYFHKINDTNIESQVAGRLQRIGRKYNAQIHYLCYKNESARM